jgi:hypothetical protein
VVAGKVAVITLGVLLLVSLAAPSGQASEGPTDSEGGYDTGDDDDDGPPPPSEVDMVEPAGKHMMNEMMGAGMTGHIGSWDAMVAAAEDEYQRLEDGDGNITKTKMKQTSWALMNASSADFWDDLSEEEKAAIVHEEARIAAAAIPAAQSSIIKAYDDVMGTSGSANWIAELLMYARDMGCQYWKGLVDFSYFVPASEFYSKTRTVCHNLADVALSIVVPVLYTTGTVVGSVEEAGERALNSAVSSSPSQSDDDGDGAGSDWEEEYDITQDVTTDPDRDNASILLEYQWDTIPVNESESSLGELEVHKNAQDYDGDAWIDGKEIRYWSNYMDQVLDQRTAEQVGFENSEEPKTYADWLNDDGDNLTRTFLYDAEVSWYQLVYSLNDNTTAAWRHPGFFLDTDGDGVPNVKDPDSDTETLLDGNTLMLERGEDERFHCFAGQGGALDDGTVSDSCDPYEDVALRYHEVPSEERDDSDEDLPW